jgi:hypothetical protein
VGFELTVDGTEVSAAEKTGGDSECTASPLPGEAKKGPFSCRLQQENRPKK